MSTFWPNRRTWDGRTEFLVGIFHFLIPGIDENKTISSRFVCPQHWLLRHLGLYFSSSSSCLAVLRPNQPQSYNEGGSNKKIIGKFTYRKIRRISTDMRQSRRRKYWGFAYSQLRVIRKQENGQPPCFLGNFLDFRVSPPQFLRRPAGRQGRKALVSRNRSQRANTPQFLLKITKFYLSIS